MDASELRRRQAPLKSRYRTEPATAIVTMTRGGQLDPARLAVAIDRPQGPAVAGLHVAAGGDGTQLCSGDMLLEALAACAGVTLLAVACALGVTIRSGSVTATGDVDFRGTLGVDKTVGVGMTSLAVAFILDTEAGEAELAKLCSLTERYCVVGRTLADPAAVAMSVKSGK